MKAETIDQVIDQLGAIVADTQYRQDAAGYFPALYKRVTAKVRDGIAEGIFEDGERMERFDVVFANRYLDAYRQHLDGAEPTSCWQLSFDMTQDYWPTVLQHLLVGMNAHILLDLGLAAARTAPGETLQEMQGDFNKINEILFALIDEVQDQLAEIWPLFGVIERVIGRLDEKLAVVSMKKFRDSAWEVAQQAAFLQGEPLRAYISVKDREVRCLGDLIRKPGFILTTQFRSVRLCERGTVGEKIKILDR